MDTPDSPGLAPSGRTTTMESFGALLDKMATEAGIAKGLGLHLRPTDTVTSPFSKWGTTWLQQMAHSLRTRGDMDFDDISRVAPRIEMSTDAGTTRIRCRWPAST